MTKVVPCHRPWSAREDAVETERRFQRDRAGWLRRIDCARRTSYVADDPVAPYNGCWTTSSARPRSAA